MALEHKEKQLLLNVLLLLRDKLDIGDLTEKEETELKNLLEIVKPMVKNQTARKENKKQEYKHMIFTIRQGLVAYLNHSFDTYGVNNIKRVTGISGGTYQKIRTSPDYLLLETLLDAHERIEKNLTSLISETA